MATISTIPGKLDTRQSTGEVSAEQQARFDAVEAWRAGNTRTLHYLNLEWVRQEEQRQEAAAETARQAKGDPRARLAEAFARNTAVEVEVAAIEVKLRRARDQLGAVESRRQAIQATEKTERSTAVSRLVDSYGCEPVVEITAPISRAAELQRLATEIEFQTDGCKGVEAELAAAQKRASEAGHLVDLAIVDVAIDHAVELANELQMLRDEVRNRSNDLDCLVDVLTAKHAKLAFPKIVDRARTPVDPILHGLKPTRPAPDWRARLAALKTDYAAEL